MTEQEGCALPPGVEVYSTRYCATAAARCTRCDQTWVYWDCACELEHVCA